MAGEEPTTGAKGETSQRLMMEEMRYALKALVEGWVVTSLWYDQHVTMFSDKKTKM